MTMTTENFASMGDIDYVSLKRFKQTLRSYQQKAVESAFMVPAGGRLMMSFPCGTGKGTAEIHLLRVFLARGDDAVIVTPSIEVIRGYLERCGATEETLSGTDDYLVKLAEQIHVHTPIRLRNAIKREDIDPPDTLIIDEVHHAVDTTISGGGLRAICPGARWIGFTATPYRGTPDETRALHEAWGEPEIILTVPQAVDVGAWALPSWRIVPLVDDDDAPIVKGDINADELTMTAIDPIADFIAKEDLKVPTCVTLSSVEAAKALDARLRIRQIETRVVLGETEAPDRAEAYARVKQGGCLLISVKVLGEGVDFPWLRRWIDASPTISPVSFMQKLGRITRPGEIQPEYIGTNRNLERHGYLLQGSLPRDVIKKVQDSFGSPSSRGGRAGLLKCVKRAKPLEIPLKGGVKGSMWSLYYPGEGGQAKERCIILDPTSERVISAERDVRVKKEDGTEDWGKWSPCDLPENPEGFKVSKLKGYCSEKQFGWWQKAGDRYGLDPTVRPTKAQFFALPVLKDLDASMESVLVKPSASFVRNLLEVGTPKPDPHEKTTPDARGGVQCPTGAPDATRVTTGPGTPAIGVPTGGHRDVPGGVPEGPKPLEVGPSPILQGYYTVVREDGGHRTYRLETMKPDSNFAPGKTVLGMLTGPENTRSYTNMAFVDSRGVMCWRRFKGSELEIRKDWAAIVGDKEGSGKRYAMASGRCYRCGRMLTDPQSISSGIGPICGGME